MLSRSPRGELFTRGYRSNRGCRDFGHSGGKTHFPMRRWDYKPSYNGPSVRAGKIPSRACTTPHGTFPFIIHSSTRALSTRESDDHLPA
jgi:hypothetical protein